MTIINDKTFYISLSIFLLVMVILIKLNFKHTSLLPIAILCVLGYFYYIWQKNQKVTNIQNNDALLNKLLKYPNLHQIYNDSKKLIKYANFTNFKNSVSYILKLLNIYNIIMENINVINNLSFSYHYYQLLHQYGDKATHSFKNMQANIPVGSKDINLFNIQYNELQNEVKKYLAETTQLNNDFLDKYESLSHYTMINK